MAILIAIISPRNGRVSARIGRRATTTISLSVIGLACGFLAWQGPAAPLLVLAGGLVVAGAGFGLLSAPLVGEVSRRFGDDRRSLALGMYNLAFFLGSASGGAIATGFVQAGVDIGPFTGRPLAGASTGLLLLAVMPLAILAFDRLRPGVAVTSALPAAVD
jgi:MFS family permease